MNSPQFKNFYIIQMIIYITKKLLIKDYYFQIINQIVVLKFIIMILYIFNKNNNIINKKINNLIIYLKIKN